jgi:alpha-beta hydrolase superfamily lysophospholipase
MKEVHFDVEGESVAGSLHEPPGAPRGQLVLVHGLLSQRTEFAEAGAALAQKGWRVLAIDQRGFGSSGGERGILSAPRATADTLGAVQWLRKEYPALPVGLVGHSMGAVFTTGAMVADPTIRAAVLAAPMKTVRAELADGEFLGYRVGNALSRAKAKLGLGPLVVPYKNRYPNLFFDKAAAKRAEKAGFLSTSVSLANYDSLLAMDTIANAKLVKQPTLVTLACGHSMFGDCKSDEAIAQVDRWMGLNLRP